MKALQRDRASDWMAAMDRGDFRTAWNLDEEVRRSRDPGTRDDPRLPYHLRWVWDGRPFDGRHALVRCYHGLGDSLQFLRYLPALRQRVASLSLEIQPELLPLLAGSCGVDRLIAFDQAHPAPASECDIEIMELASALRIEPANLPPPYLRTNPRPIGNGRVVGLCWQAGGWDADRSVPPDLFVPLLRSASVTLCPGSTDLPVLNPAGCPDTIAGTAALVTSLDLVVTVDTMMAHLAGALGVPTWVLLKHRADWRWMAARHDSTWYPAMRLYRQTIPGDWTGPLAQISVDLASRLG